MMKYKVLGFNDEICECDICGKTELKGTYALLDLETGAVVRAGRTCGAKAAGWSAKQIDAEVKKSIIESAECEFMALPEHEKMRELKKMPWSIEISFERSRISNRLHRERALIAYKFGVKLPPYLIP